MKQTGKSPPVSYYQSDGIYGKVVIKSTQEIAASFAVGELLATTAILFCRQPEI